MSTRPRSTQADDDHYHVRCHARKLDWCNAVEARLVQRVLYDPRQLLGLRVARPPHDTAMIAYWFGDGLYPVFKAVGVLHPSGSVKDTHQLLRYRFVLSDPIF
jgi:hypothetical protein